MLQVFTNVSGTIYFVEGIRVSAGIGIALQRLGAGVIFDS